MVTCRCRTGTLKNPTKFLWRWEHDRRYNFFFNPPAHLCRHIYDWNIVARDVNHQKLKLKQISYQIIVLDFVLLTLINVTGYIPEYECTDPYKLTQASNQTQNLNFTYTIEKCDIALTWNTSNITNVQMQQCPVGYTYGIPKDRSFVTEVCFDLQRACVYFYVYNANYWVRLPRQKLLLLLNWLFNVTINDISVIYVTAHRCAGGLKKKLDLRSGSQRRQKLKQLLWMW